MCIIKDKYDKDTYTGYKVGFINRKGNFCSVVTGKPYKVGKVPKLTNRNKCILGRGRKFTVSFDIKAVYGGIMSSFKPEYTGYTGLIQTLDDTKELRLDMEANAREHKVNMTFAIAEIIISNDLYNALLSFDWSKYPAMVGKTIDKIKVLK